MRHVHLNENYLYFHEFANKFLPYVPYGVFNYILTFPLQFFGAIPKIHVVGRFCIACIVQSSLERDWSYVDKMDNFDLGDESTYLNHVD